jgi:hypothetical protein
MYRKAMSTHMDTGAALAEDDARQVTGLGQRKRKERFIRTEIRDMGRFGTVEAHLWSPAANWQRLH